MRLLQTRMASWTSLPAIIFCTCSITLLPWNHLLAAEPEQASDKATPDTAASGAPDQLQEIMVSAQRITENLQTVPIAIETLSSEQVLARGVTNVQSLTTTVPNINFQTANDATNIILRGVGDVSSSPNNEASTAVYVDGVYNAQSQGLTSFQFNNIERIEVLEGPQGTLFGRNATAGVVQIITPDPKQEFSGKVDAGYGNLGTYSGDIYLTGGITDKLSADISLLGFDQSDAYGHDWYTTAGVNGPSYPILTMKAGAARSKWLYKPTDATQIRFVLDYTSYDAFGGAPISMSQYSANLSPTTIPKAPYQFSPAPGMFNTFEGIPQFDDNTQGGAALTVDQDIGSSMHFQSISSYRWFAGNANTDGVWVPQHMNYVATHFDGHYETQEFHLTNQNPGRITWLLGAFYFGDQIFAADPRINSGTAVKTGLQTIQGVQDTASGSVFGQATAGLTDKLKFTLGVRYTDELIKGWNSTQNAMGKYTVGPIYETQRDDPLTWRGALDYQFNPDILGYIAYNKGFKTGGFNLASPGTAPYFGEHLDDYEIGMKSEFLDHRIRFNVDGFYYHYTDMQVTILVGGGVLLFTNAANSRIYGLDESLDFVLTDHLTVTTGVGLLNAKYLSWPKAITYTPGGIQTTIPNAAGADLPYAPASSGYVSLNYHDLKTPVGMWHATMSLSYKDRTFVTPDMALEEPTYYMLDATLEWRPLSDNSWAVRLWGKNLTNAAWALWGTEGSQGWGLSYGMPRTYGVTVEKHF
jgi:iron complex outermembrane receptor protein